MNELDAKRKVAKLIQRALRGEIAMQDAVHEVELIETNDCDVLTALHALCHHRDDADLHPYDADYCKLQENGLREIADRLSTNVRITNAEVYWKK